ncbi:F0F1 ATP synthase subunit delta [Endothiovibrio diazotrophicus]
MLIDWFTVGAQLLNFLVLAWLLKRFLYRPILDALDARERRIAAELADADAKRAAADEEREAFRRRNEAFDRQRAERLSQATDEAKAERQRLLDDARRAVDTLKATRMEALRNDTHNLHQAIARRTRQEVFAIARKALADLATASLEERMGEVFTRRLRALDGEAREVFAEALRTADGPARVRSAFELPEASRLAIRNALDETFSAEIDVTFETDAELISGIELATHGQMVGWSIGDYLVSLERGVDELLKSQSKPEINAGAVTGSETGPETGSETGAGPEQGARE